MRNTPSSPVETSLPAPRPANRAERRAAARGKAVGGDAPRAIAPRSTGPREHTKPAHVRADFVARRGG